MRSPLLYVPGDMLMTYLGIWTYRTRDRALTGNWRIPGGSVYMVVISDTDELGTVMLRVLFEGRIAWVTARGEMERVS